MMLNVSFDGAGSKPRLRNAQLRYAHYYEQVLMIANELFAKGGECITQALRMLDADWVHVQLGEKMTIQYPRDEDGDLLASQFSEAGDEILPNYQPPSERIRWLKDSIQAAQRLNDFHAECRHLSRLGMAYFDLGNYEEAINCYQKALRSPTVRSGLVLSRMGQAYAYLGEYDKAEECHKHGREIARKDGDKKTEGYCMSGLGWIYSDHGDYQQALEYYKEGVRLAQETGDKVSEGIRLPNLGGISWRLGDAENAIRYHTQGLDIAKEVHDKRREGTRNFHLGCIYRHLGRYEEAEKHLKSAITIAIEIDDRRSTGFSYGVLGECFAEQGRFETALEYHNIGLVDLRELRISKYLTFAEIGLGETYTLMRHYEKALPVLTSALALARKERNPAALLTVNTAIARIYLHSGQPADALPYIGDALQCNVPKYNHCANLISGILFIRTGDYDSARKAFSISIESAKDLIMKSPGLYRPKYTCAVAGCALALLEIDQGSRKRKLDIAAAYFQAALENCSAVGVVNDMIRLIDELSILDNRNSLSSIYSMLQGISRSSHYKGSGTV